jgi:hypothetical protein
MSLTPAQQTILKDDITPLLLGGQEFDGLEPASNSDDANTIAAAYNLLSSPDYTVWEGNVSLEEVGTNLDGVELGNLTTANSNRLAVFFQTNTGGAVPSRLDHRAFFDDVFSGAGGATTRANLLLVWKRLSLRIEELLASGTGTDPDPATMGFEGSVNYHDIQDAMRT